MLLHGRKLLQIGMRQKECGTVFVHELGVAAQIDVRHHLSYLFNLIESLARKHEVWLGVPEGHELCAFNLPARMLTSYQDLDALLSR